ncbi:MAG: hypothetical protein P4M11_12965 [Candidatus Pacebacteria bacterium]|nr:hypothetical protein [Candidatus Paceibacterota bacterium]
MTETKKQYEKPMQPLGLNGGLRGAKQQVDAVGQLLRSNPLARAVWSMFGRPGMGMKASFENQHPLPIKEPPDEDVIDDQARVTSPIAVSKLVHTEGSIVLSKPARRSRGNSLDSTTERRKRIVELLREVVEITTEQSEYISREMNDAKDKYRLATQHRHRENEKEKLLTEQRSNVTMNVPKIPFTKNKVLKNMQAGGGNLVMYAHDNFALVFSIQITNRAGCKHDDRDKEGRGFGDGIPRCEARRLLDRVEVLHCTVGSTQRPREHHQVPQLQVHRLRPAGLLQHSSHLPHPHPGLHSCPRSSAAPCTESFLSNPG